MTATREETSKDSTHDAGENESSTDKHIKYIDQNPLGGGEL